MTAGNHISKLNWKRLSFWANLVNLFVVFSDAYCTTKNTTTTPNIEGSLLVGYDKICALDHFQQDLALKSYFFFPTPSPHTFKVFESLFPLTSDQK